MRALGWSLVVASPLSFGLLCLAAAPARAQSDPGAIWTVGGPPAPPPAPAPSSPPAPGPSSDPAPSSPPAAPPEPPSPPPDGASWQLGAGLSGALYSAKYVDFPDTGGNSAGGSLSTDRFLGPVVDDGAPRSLQPFLQRTSQVSASIGGGVSTIRNPYGGADRTSGRSAPTWTRCSRSTGRRRRWRGSRAARSRGSWCSCRSAPSAGRRPVVFKSATYRGSLTPRRAGGRGRAAPRGGPAPSAGSSPPRAGRRPRRSWSW